METFYTECKLIILKKLMRISYLFPSLKETVAKRVRMLSEFGASRKFYGSSVNKFRWGMNRASFYVLLFLWIGLKGKKHSFTNSSP